MAHHVHDVTPEPGNYTTPGDATKAIRFTFSQVLQDLPNLSTSKQFLLVLEQEVK